MNKKLVILTLSLLAVTMLPAQNIIRPKVECPNGIYVNSYNGVLFYQRPDVSVANRNMRLEAVFYYNSSSNKKNYGYGNGWSLGSELRFVNDSLGVIIEQGDGRQDLYTRYGNSFEAPAGVFSTLSMEGDGYLLTYKDGTKYYFADTVAKKVTMVKDRYDNAITFTYQDGNLISASDISARSLYFAWSNDLLSGISTSFDDRTWSYQYDENGNLTAVTDPMGYTVHYAYNKDNRIKTFTDAEGYSTHISYNTDGMAHRVKTDVTDKSIRYELAKQQTIFVDYLTDANNQYTKYVWDEQGRLVEIENVNMGTSTKFAYDDDNNLVYREDANGNAYTYTYDENGNQLSSTDPLGHTESFTYESVFNNISSYQNKNGSLFTFDYDDKGNLIASHGPLNYTIHFSYNSYGQIVSFVDANGNIIQYNQDEYGNLASITDAKGNTTSFTYLNSWLLNKITYPDTGIVTINYDLKGRITTLIDQIGQTTTYQYNSRNNIITLFDKKSNQFHYQYDAIGHLIVFSNALGANNHFRYNANGYLVEFIDALGNKTNYAYNDQNQLIMETNALGQKTHYTMDNVGNITSISYPSGKKIFYNYDALDRVLSVSDNIGLLKTFVYDPNGNLLQTIDPDGGTLSFEYNELNRIVQRTNLLGKNDYYSYDPNGNLLTILNRNNNATCYTYDANNNMIASSDELNHSTLYDYDAMDHIVSVTDANGNQTSFQYDLRGYRNQISFADGTTRKFWHDESGNIITKQDENGNIITYSYDAINRLVSCHYPDESEDSFVYDLNNNLISAINKDAVVTASYDALGRIVQETLNGKTTQYQYDVNNRKLSMIYPNGRVIEKEYDARLRLSDINENNEMIAAFIYNDDNTISQRIYGNGVVTEYSYNPLHQLASIEDNIGLSSLQMIYDNMGNATVKKDMLLSQNSETFTYNSNNQLVSYSCGIINTENQIENPTQYIGYSFDAVGNRTIVDINGEAYHYSCNNKNAYTTISGAQNITMQYDANGNMIDDGERTMQYDYNNHLISIDNGSVASYKYDALNRRIQKKFIENGVENTINYYYSNQQAIEERDGNDVVIASYIYGTWLDDYVQMKRNGSYYYYHQDGSNNVVSISDELGSLVERCDYDPYGKVTLLNAMGEQIHQSLCENMYLFSGRYFDSESEFYYYRNRSMNPSLGRFLQVDPYLYLDGMNVYSYVNNRPTVLIDPMGTNSTSPMYGAGYNNNQFSYCSNGDGINYIGVNANACLALGVGACVDVEIGWIIQGEDASFLPVVNVGVGVEAGFAVEASANLVLKDVENRDDARNRGISIHGGVAGELDAGPLGIGGQIYYENGRTVENIDGTRFKSYNSYQKIVDGVDLGPIGSTLSFDIDNKQIQNEETRMNAYGIGESLKASVGVRFGWGF